MDYWTVARQIGELEPDIAKDICVLNPHKTLAVKGDTHAGGVERKLNNVVSWFEECYGNPVNFAGCAKNASETLASIIGGLYLEGERITIEDMDRLFFRDDLPDDEKVTSRLTAAGVLALSACYAFMYSFNSGDYWSVIEAGNLLEDSYFLYLYFFQAIKASAKTKRIRFNSVVQTITTQFDLEKEGVEADLVESNGRLVELYGNLVDYFNGKLKTDAVFASVVIALYARLAVILGKPYIGNYLDEVEQYRSGAISGYLKLAIESVGKSGVQLSLEAPAIKLVG
ncbi:hypothetical protein [Paraburkholderia fungorum]|jgi:hypothetical protein|uniref:hypothetical protein n=1 Tax=Paraburkholderia fungorum TaxID=134537 RepID=UPI000D04C14D|nr:hypothetical protein [Paraburkholderia fungorum]PRZ45402.1 hypothetical protein BX589_13981 [Paraburkholderia fungorum]